MDYNKIDKTTKTGIGNVIKSVLKEGVNKWGGLDYNNKVQKPKDSIVLKGWNFIDKLSDSGNYVKLHDVYAFLIEPPYGYDNLTFCLVLSLWMGYHKNRFDIVENGKKISIEQFSGYFEKLEIIKRIKKKKLLIKKLSKSVLQEEITNIKNRVINCDDYHKLKSLIEKATQMVNDERYPYAIRQKLKFILPQKNLQIKATDQFNKSVADCYEDIEQASNLEKIVEVRNCLTKIIEPQDCDINFSKEKYKQAFTLCDKKIKIFLNQASIDLQKKEDYPFRKQELSRFKDLLDDAGLATFVQIVKNQMIKLENQKKKLEERDKERQVLQIIDALPPPAHLPYHQVESYIQEIKAHLEQLKSESSIQRVENKEEEYQKHLDALKNKITELSEAVYSIKSLNEWHPINQRVESARSLYKGSKYEDRFPEFLEQLTKEKPRLEDQERKKKEREDLLNYFQDTARRSGQSNNILFIYELYKEILDKPYNEEILIQDDQQRIQKNIDQIFFRFEELMEKELKISRISSDEDYHKKNVRLKEHEKTIQPVGKIDDKFINSLKNSIRQLEKEYRNFTLDKRIIEIGKLSLNTINQCVQAMDKLKELQDELGDKILTNETFAKTLKTIENKRKSHINTFNEIGDRLDKTIEHKSLVELKDRLYRNRYIFDGSQLIRDFDSLLSKVERKISFLSKFQNLKYSRQDLDSCEFAIESVQKIKNEYNDIWDENLERILKKKISQISGAKRSILAEKDKWMKEIADFLNQADPEMQQCQNIRKKIDSKKPSGITEEDLKKIHNAEHKVREILDRDKTKKVLVTFGDIKESQIKTNCLIELFRTLSPEEREKVMSVIQNTSPV